MNPRRRIWLAGYLVIWLAGGLLLAQEKPAGQGFQFRSSTDRVNVTLTLTDANGRFVPNLTGAYFARIPPLSRGPRRPLPELYGPPELP